ncbi:MAG: isoprenyl transferase [Desulfobacteraceae bacterium 4572_35.1]|nr:MAG: isoprenyl transferase [Desulfobacteraceae bacterium 4572_35.1]
MILPQHLAIIMDGNGRWAQLKGLPRIAGHQRGVNTVRNVVKKCANLGVRYLTLYAFSSENWKRPAGEVQALMSLLGVYLESEMELLQENGIRLQVIGDLTKLPEKISKSLQHSVSTTQENSGMTLTLALSYGARDEIVRATQRLMIDVNAGKIVVADISEESFSAYLDTATMPDPDLLIRTSGEMRISNFLLWQSAYTELYFCSCFWPEFDDEQLQLALEDYSGRCRRFGAVVTSDCQQQGEFEEKAN